MRTSQRQRRDRIYDELLARTHVTAADLAVSLGVSEATIRRDLHALAAAGQAELAYGGATVARGSDFSFRSKARRNVDAKRRIAGLAAGLIDDGDQVFVDSGTTCFAMLPFLRPKRDVVVIGNSARLAVELDSPHVRVILLGGHYRPARMDTVGPLALNALSQLRGYTAFVGADGLSREFGLAAADIESAHLYALAVEHASETVLLADASKFAAPSLCKICDWDRIRRVVTDREPEPAWQEFFSEMDIDVLCPGPEGAGDSDTGDG